jgi:hypothetical protein
VHQHSPCLGDPPPLLHGEFSDPSTASPRHVSYWSRQLLARVVERLAEKHGLNIADAVGPSWLDRLLAAAGGGHLLATQDRAYLSDICAELARQHQRS